MSLTVSPAGTHLPPAVTDLVAAWAPGRRWYPGGTTATPRPWLEVSSEDAPGVVVALLRLGDATPGTTVLQVPLVLSPAGSGADDDAGVIGRATGFTVHDGGTHPDAWALYLRAASLPADTTGGRAICGEQSNTSVILPAARPDGAPHGTMLKILRTVAAGAHPDVVVPQALTGAGFTGTPRFLGAVELPAASASPPGAPQLGPATHHLAVAAALVPDAHDGFELACAHAREHRPFDALAADLGAVVARLHAALRECLPVHARLDPAAFVGGLHRRADAALDAAPALAPHATAVRRVLADLQEHLTALPLQRIHGDLHLGQALHGTGPDGVGGWQLLDFEGEPQRPVAERTAPDLPVRDVAGMLRSFDYAAAVGGATDPAWATNAQQAFLDGYRATIDANTAPTTAADDAVLRALVLDKALYEVVYETRQRPHWVHIPLAAVERIVGGASV